MSSENVSFNLEQFKALTNKLLGPIVTAVGFMSREQCKEMSGDDYMRALIAHISTLSDKAAKFDSIRQIVED